MIKTFNQVKGKTLPFGPYTQSVLGWGLKPSAERAKNYADKHKLPFWRVEDGFIGYLSHPTDSSKLLSLAVDTRGIYYDATRQSDLELYIKAGIPATSTDKINYSNDEYKSPREQLNQLERVKALHKSLIDGQVTKYNLAGQVQPTPELNPNSVLVIDQTFGDLSVKHSYASEQSFTNMLEAAIDENPNQTVYVKTHPDVLLGKKSGFLTPDKIKHQQVEFIFDACNPAQLINQVDKVYTVCSQMGFESLILGKQVVTFACPFYAGWGLTDDRCDIPKKVLKRRSLNTTKHKVSIEELIYAAFIQYPRYVHPDTQQRCDVEDIIDYIALQKKQNTPKHNTLYCCDFSLWKRAFLPYFLKGIGLKVKFINSDKLLPLLQANQIKQQDAIVLWGAKPLTKSVNQFIHAKALKLPILRIEDGFIRSVGLGADLRRPASLVIDSRGIYFDPRQSSDLEHILLTKTFSEHELMQAEQLVHQLVQTKVSKYNVAEQSDELALIQQHRQRTILVVGQVEDDASIQTGCVDVNTNLGLLKQVRLNNPDAYIVYKPHPDVLSGNRQGHVQYQQVVQYADLQVTGAGIIDTLEQVDELHTMTSLAGFEALLRAKKVVCYGLPFYAGWGLTCDKHAIKRRNRSLTLAQLCYGVLVEYPLYVNYETGLFTKPQTIVNNMTGKQEKFVQRSHLTTLFSRNWRKIRFLYDAFMTNK